MTFVRTFRLNNGKKISQKVFHPLVVIVLPHASSPLVGLFNDYHLNSRNIEEMVKNNESLTNIEATLRDSLNYIDSGDTKNLFLANIVQASVVWAVLSLLLGLLHVIVPLTCKYTICLTAMYFIHCSSLENTQAQQLAIQQIMYDIFLSIADTDYEFVRDMLLTDIETECKQIVYFKRHIAWMFRNRNVCRTHLREQNYNHTFVRWI